MKGKDKREVREAPILGVGERASIFRFLDFIPSSFVGNNMKMCTF
jgi:hypothetical protein